MGLVDAFSSGPFADRIFVASTTAACVVSAVLVALRPSAFGLASRGYVARLVRPWRLLTFVLSGAVFTFGAPYMGDPTWDRVDGALMSGLTYVLAPWATGTLYRAVRRRATAVEVLVATASWLLAVSVCYEVYLVLRDGRLPPTTWSNLVASSAAFFSAGLFWSLTHDPARGVIFGFMSDDWPRDREETRIGAKMVVVALFIAIVIGLVLSPFVVELLR